MIGNLKGEHDSIHSIKYIVDNNIGNHFKVVFNRDVAYYIDENLEIFDMEGLSDINKKDLELIKKVISEKIK